MSNAGLIGQGVSLFAQANTQKRRLALVLLLVVFFWLDRGTKWMIQDSLAIGESWPLLKDVFHITHVQNAGIAFSLFHQYPAVLVIATSVLFLGFLIYSLTRNPLQARTVLPLSLLLGGALGNIYDRMMFGRVIDYLDVVAIRYPIFNLADVFIFCGVGLMVLYYVRDQFGANHRENQ
jgi:signal peptidase II